MKALLERAGRFRNNIKMNKLIVGIIGGRGMLGTIFKKFFGKYGFKVLISGRKTKLTNIDLVKKADVVIFSVPITSTIKVIRQVLPYTRKNQLLMDFTSIKEMPIKEMLKSKASVIGLHPMFGKVDSLRGKTVIVIPARPGKWLNFILSLFKKEKINFKITNAKKHDEIMAILQGLIHFNFITTAYSLEEISKKKKITVNDLLEFGGIVYRLRVGIIARILDQDPELYADLAICNKNTRLSIKKYEEIVKKLNDIIKKRNKKEFIKFFIKAQSFFKAFNKQAFKESTFLIEQLSKFNKKKQITHR